MNVHVKWGTKKIDLVLHPDKPIVKFMEDLQKLTGVPLNRQKLAMKRKPIKPEGNWDPNDVKEGMQFMLIGTAELPPVPLETQEEEVPIATESDEINPLEDPNIMIGLHNFGNTCYLNACLQTLRNLPKFAEICKASDPPNTPGNNMLAHSFCDLLRNFPARLPDFIATLRRFNPMFAEQDPVTHVPRQQDASEAWGCILTALIGSLGSQIKDLFSIGYAVRETCPELDGLTRTIEDTDDRLRCFITQETKQIEFGISMDAILEREDKTLGRNVLWNTHRAITKLPPYLTVQMMRFTFKKDENLVAKICRKVDIPMRLDTLEWLAPALRARVAKKREDAVLIKSNAGFYRLKAVLTHRGRSADSGHYITHVRFEDQWVRYDDEKVKEVSEEDIAALSGSGDWHTSFILIYEAYDEPY